jgi:hypothetical protein
MANSKEATPVSEYNSIVRDIKNRRVQDPSFYNSVEERSMYDRMLKIWDKMLPNERQEVEQTS